MYAQSAAKNARHELADTTTNISALSRIVVRVFEHTHGRQFRAIPSATAMLQAHPPSLNIISVLSTGLHALNHSGFDLSPTDVTLFNDLRRGNAIVQLRLAMKAFRKQEKK